MDKAQKFQFTTAIDYTADGVVSKQIIKKKSGNITLFAFDKGQALSEHTAPFDALVQVVEGEAEIIIDQQSYILTVNDSIILPAGIPHAVKAVDSFKMILTMIRESSNE